MIFVLDSRGELKLYLTGESAPHSCSCIAIPWWACSRLQSNHPGLPLRFMRSYWNTRRILSENGCVDDSFLVNFISKNGEVNRRRGIVSTLLSSTWSAQYLGVNEAPRKRQHSLGQLTWTVLKGGTMSPKSLRYVFA